MAKSCEAAKAASQDFLFWGGFEGVGVLFYCVGGRGVTFLSPDKKVTKEAGLRRR